jgi:hypothetical protein
MPQGGMMNQGPQSGFGSTLPHEMKGHNGLNNMNMPQGQTGIAPNNGNLPSLNSKIKSEEQLATNKETLTCCLMF